MIRILVVDDDDAVRSAFELALELPSFEVRTMGAANEALAALAEFGADLIFLDLSMPDCNGIDLLRLIRHTDRVTPVFIVTGFAEVHMSGLRKAAADGLDFNLLRKPLDLEEIQAAARAGLAAGQRREVVDPCSI
jgi:DNA-binding response OmpR family regulator